MMMTILDPNPHEFPSTWAVASGLDRYGLWQAIEINGVRQVMRWIEPGRFVMGSPQEERERHEDETQHGVTISQGYWLADTACTQGFWRAVTGSVPKDNDGSPDLPVTEISWNDGQHFIEQCNALVGEGLTLRLPTEAEWEFACRAGSETAYFWGDEFRDEYANSKIERVPALKFAPNGHGLFQMHGNISEWCEDWYGAYPKEDVRDPEGPGSGQSRLLRGGSWFLDGRLARSAFRLHRSPDLRDGDFGLRLAGGTDPTG